TAMNNPINKQDGFIALISAIIISLLLLTITVVLNFSAFFGRFNVLDSEFKETSVGLAEACVDVAMLELEKNPAYTGSASIDIDSVRKCKVRLVYNSGSFKVIETQAEYNRSFTNLRVKVTIPPGVTVSSWEELPNF
ncbi:MAG: hypothetical protein Q7R49_00405, partial [Candidatus Daviesbacteria bacterium]|nr:hypothetical protein [Candidatus Daviesbacteria bacterium]